MKPGRLKEAFRPARRVQFNMRLPLADRVSLFKAARTIDKSVAAYLLGLHRYAIGQERQP